MIYNGQFIGFRKGFGLRYIISSDKYRHNQTMFSPLYFELWVGFRALQINRQVSRATGPLATSTNKAMNISGTHQNQYWNESVFECTSINQSVK